jgi:hypothetical protein
MRVVVVHGSGGVDVEDLQALAERSRAALMGGQAPVYTVVWAGEGFGEAMEVRRRLKAEMQRLQEGAHEG